MEMNPAVTKMKINGMKKFYQIELKISIARIFCKDLEDPHSLEHFLNENIGALDLA